MAILSIIVPVYNEEVNVEACYEALVKACAHLEETIEILFVDDGSNDSSFEIIGRLAAKDPRVRGFKFSRNFGSHSACMAGFVHARGDAVMIISADLQDPPELIPEMVRKWREGHHVVWAVRDTRDDPFMKTLMAKMFYRLHRLIAQPNYPKTGMDFGLFDRKVVDEIRRLKETNLFIIGMIVWMGFRQATIPYHRRARERGVSKWPFMKRIKSALDGIISFSYAPVRFISYFGIVVSAISFLFACFILIERFWFGYGGTGWQTAMVIILFMGGIQMCMLGLIGEYVWRGLDNTRRRPQFVVMETVNEGERRLNA